MNSRMAIASIALIGSVTFSSSAALAQEPTTMEGCLHLSKRVAEVLATNQDSPNYRTAQDERRNGQAYCASGFYARGISSYEHALSNLGQGEMSDLGQNKS